MFRFTPNHRIRQTREFSAVLASGSKVTSQLFSIFVKNRVLPQPRLGIVVPKRLVSTAVSRHKIQRLIRETFRLQQHLLPSADFVVAARTKLLASAKNPEIFANLNSLWQKVSSFSAKD